MRDNLKQPCKECPFLKDSVPGYLGPWEGNAVLQYIGVDVFPCHMTLKAGDTYGEESPRAAYCAGAALHMNAKCQVCRKRDVADYQDKLRGSPAQDLVFQNSKEFRNYHNVSDLVTQLTVVFLGVGPSEAKARRVGKKL